MRSAIPDSSPTAQRTNCAVDPRHEIGLCHATSNLLTGVRDLMIRRFLMTAALTLLLPAASCRPRARQPAAFFEKHCYSCHDATVKKGGLDLSALKVEPSQPGQLRALGEGPRPDRVGRDAAEEEGPAAGGGDRRRAEVAARHAREGGAGEAGGRRPDRAAPADARRVREHRPRPVRPARHRAARRTAGRRLGPRLRQQQRRARHLARQPRQVHRGRRPGPRHGHRHAAQAARRW